MDFTGKTVVVTGAGKGIGRSTAKLLAARGARIVAISRTAADLESLEAEIGCRSIVVDLADAAATRAAAEAMLPADHLVNNAAIALLEPFTETSEEAMDLTYAVNVRAPMILARAFARERIASGRGGAIVNVSSVSSFTGFPNHAAYCMSKAGLDGMTRVMANELGRHGIRVNAVNPTVVLTPMGERAWSDPEKAGPLLKRLPTGRFAQPDEVAEAIAFLLSDAASMINGIAMPVDGGFGIA